MKFSTFSKYFIVIFLAIFMCVRIYYRATDDFRLGNISYDIPYNQDWSIPELSEEENNELEKILGQTFSYIGKGAQSYAFVSEDDQYVLKFFKFKHLRPSWIIDNLPEIGYLKTFKELEQYKKQRKLLSVFNGYRLAYEVHKNESGLLYVHLNKTNHLKKKVTVLDKIGVERSIDLDEVNFVIQKKVVTSKKKILDDLAVGNLDEAILKIYSLFDLYLQEYSKGIYDHDHGVLHNTGFIGSKPIHLDVGKLYRDENIHKNEYAKKDLGIVADKIITRVGEVYPEYKTEITERIDLYMKNAFDSPSDVYRKCYLNQ